MIKVKLNLIKKNSMSIAKSVRSKSILLITLTLKPQIKSKRKKSKNNFRL